MIDKIILKNFQSHKETILDLSDRLNIIIGSSNTGKTSILRGIGWVVYNRPSGKEIISKNVILDGKQIEPTSVKIIFDKGEIERIRFNNNNIYNINNIELKAVGRDVPKEVNDLLGISEINFQKQFDSPFLISWSPPEVTRFINKLTKLNYIDILFEKIRKDKRYYSSKINDKEIELNTLKKEKDRLSKFLGKGKELDRKLENVKEKIDELNFFIDKLKNLIDIIYITKKKLEKYKNIPKVKKLVSKLIVVINEIKEIEDKKSKVINLISKIKNVKSMLLQYNNIEKRKSILLRLGKIIQKIDKYKDEVNKLSEIIENYIKRIGKLRKIKQTINEAKNRLPEICPLCNGTGRLR